MTRNLELSVYAYGTADLSRYIDSKIACPFQDLPCRRYGRDSRDLLLAKRGVQLVACHFS